MPAATSAIHLIEAAYGISSGAVDKRIESISPEPTGDDEAPAKWVKEEKSMRRSMTNDLFKEFQQESCFDVAKALWKSKNLKLHFQNKHKDISQTFAKEEDEQMQKRMELKKKLSK